MAELTYRSAVAHGIAQEMRGDPSLVMLGQDVGPAGGVFKTTLGLWDEFGRDRVRDTPISEQAILGAAMGAAEHRMTDVLGISPHAFMVAAIRQAVHGVEKRAAFIAQARDARAEMLAEGQGYAADDVRAYLRSRLLVATVLHAVA